MVGVVYLAFAVSMHAERLWGWPFLILSLVVGLIGGAGAVFAWDRLKAVWSRFPTKHKVLLIGAVIALMMAVSFVSNYGKSDATSNMLIELGGIVFALLLWGFYWLFCRFLDAIWARLHNR
jgi:hypothetical protein